MTPATDAAREARAREIAWKLVIGEKVGGGDGQTYVGRTPTVREIEAALLAFADTEAASQPREGDWEKHPAFSGHERMDWATLNGPWRNGGWGDEVVANRTTVMRFIGTIDALLAALTQRPPEQAGAEIRAITVEMRRFMPNACGDWADKINAALAGNARKVAFYDEGGVDIRPGETLADRDRRIYQQGRHDALNDEPEAFI